MQHCKTTKSNSDFQLNFDLEDASRDDNVIGSEYEVY